MQNSLYKNQVNPKRGYDPKIHLAVSNDWACIGAPEAGYNHPLYIARAEEFTEAIGFPIYSNSKHSVESFRSIFELLWNERALNEELKNTETMQKEFINMAFTTLLYMNNTGRVTLTGIL